MPGRIAVKEVRLRAGDTHMAPAYWERDHSGEDGFAIYEILVPCEHTPRCDIQCLDADCITAQVRGEPFHHHYEMQSFARDGPKTKPGATPEDIANDRANIWGWDGDTLHPTLTPSFLGPETDKKGNVIRPFRIHLFLTKGAISLCSDSTVTT